MRNKIINNNNSISNSSNNKKGLHKNLKIVNNNIIL